MRDFAAFCTLMACLIIFVAACVAFFKPLPKLRMTTKSQALRGLGVSFGLFILTAVIMPEPDQPAAGKEVAASEPAKTVESSAAKVQATLPFTVDAFSSRFNALAGKADKPWRIDNVKIDDGSFKYMLTEKIGLVGTVGTNGNMTGLIVLAGGDGTRMSGLDVFMAMAVVYCASIETADLKQCGSPLMEMVNAHAEGGDATKKIINNIEFSYARSDTIGNMLTVSPAN